MTAALLLLLIGFAGSALCAGAETGFYGINAMRLRHLAETSRSAALLARVVRSPAGLITALLIGNNVANDLVVRAGIRLAEIAGAADPAVVATLALTPAVFLFGEVLPKQWALRAPLSRMLALAAPLALLRALMWPLTAPLVAGTRALGGSGEAALARRQFEALLQEGEGQAPGEARVMTAALRALDSRGKGLASFLREDLPRIPADATLAAARTAAASGDGLVILERQGLPPALLPHGRLLDAGVDSRPAALAYPLLVLPDDADLADALSRMRTFGVAYAWARLEDGREGLCDLEYALSLLLSPDSRSSS
jgi:CBS domain containing-hemolysin-like protein